MHNFKKFIFGGLFLFAFTLFCLTISSFIEKPSNILSLETKIIVSIIFAAGLALLTSFFFVIFAVLTQKWKIIVVVFPAVMITSILFIAQNGIVVGILILLILSIIYYFLQQKLNTYITFEPNTTLSSSINLLATLMIFIASFSFYISSKQDIAKNGFKLPDSFIETTINAMPEETTIPKEMAKAAIETQLQKTIEPYMNLLPLILTVIFFISLKSLTSLISIIIGPVLWFTFWFLEKTKFINYTVEQRKVKKIVT